MFVCVCLQRKLANLEAASSCFLVCQSREENKQHVLAPLFIFPQKKEHGRASGNHGKFKRRIESPTGFPDDQLVCVCNIRTCKVQ